MSEKEPRRFWLVRHEDLTGVSGVGTVAEGVQFTDGWCSMHWRSEVTSVAVYPSIEHVKRIHGHDGKSEIVWLDRDR